MFERCRCILTNYNNHNRHEIEMLQDNTRLFCFFNAERREALREK